jgi:hypothetical protein
MSGQWWFAGSVHQERRSPSVRTGGMPSILCDVPRKSLGEFALEPSLRGIPHKVEVGDPSSMVNAIYQVPCGSD